jgi:hypothetical protein
LENIDLKGAMIDIANKYYGYIEGINKIKNNLNLLNVVNNFNEDNKIEDFNSNKDS